VATVGNTSTSFTNFDFADGSGQFNENASLFTMPENGIITSISVCCAADQGQPDCNAQLVIWNASSGNVIVASSAFSMAAHSRSTSGWAFITQSVTPTFIAANTNIYIGFFRVDSGSTLFPQTNSGHYVGKKAGGTSPSSISGATQDWGGVAGTMGAYATYTPVRAWVWNGSSWVPATVQVWNGSSWADITGLQAWNGSSWVDAQ
jgi:hypothetical protein